MKYYLMTKMFFIISIVLILYSCVKPNHLKDISDSQCVSEYSLSASIYDYDSIVFGKYELDGNTDNGTENIEWIILDKQNGRALLLSKYILDNIVYNKKQIDTDWKQCSLRQWLNSEFYDKTFNLSEKKLILPTELFDSNTTDYIYCLSLEEVNKYFNNDLIKDFYCFTEDVEYYSNNYTNASTIVTDYYNMKYYDEGGDWWLRTSGDYQDYCAYVDRGGWIDSRGTNVDNPFMGIRPVLWLKYE